MAATWGTRGGGWTGKSLASSAFKQVAALANTRRAIAIPSVRALVHVRVGNVRG